VAPYVSNSSWLQLSVVPLTALVQLAATNYNPGTGVWTDSSGNNNNATYSGGSTPTLASFATPNGGAAVSIATGSGQYFLLNSSLNQSSGYTVFAYVMPSVVSDGSRHALTGGSSSGALEYDLYAGHQDYLQEYQADVGHGTATIPTTSFSLVDLAVSSSGAAFKYNGAFDANVAGAAFGSAITRIGNNEGGGDGFFGEIAEIDIYNGVLSSNQIATIEAQLTAEYVTAASIGIGAATVAPTNNTSAGNPITLSAQVVGATGTTTFQWQTDNGTSGASFTNISGATNTSYALNTTSLLGTYEYQLIGTPFGGSSVTSAPVALTVQAASAPVVLVDTAANPSVAMVYGSDTLSASFTGNLPISYQWQVSANSSGSGAVNIPGATNTTLVLTNLQLSNSGNYYSLRATNNISPYVANSSWLQLTVEPLTPSVQLIATNYNPGSGIWTDSSGNGNNAIYSGLSTPSLVPFVTPNGGSAVSIASSENQAFFLTSSLDPSSGYTVFAYIMPSAVSDGNRHALTGGSASGALEYDIYAGHQDYLREYLQDVGNGTATIPITSFRLVDVAANSSGAAFRFNGAPDGTVAGAAFGSALTRIGNNEGGGDGYFGEIAEIDIYTGVLSSNQISIIESRFTANYITVSSIVIGAAAVAPTNNIYAGTPVTLSAPIIGESGNATFGWQTDNGISGANFSYISGATNTNYVLNTSSLLGTYEYQLIGTPFGGTPVTSAPVTVTVQAASAPTLSVDATANPSVATVDGNDTFSATFTGTLPISYQWQVSANSSGSGAVNIPGATNTTLVLSNLQLSNSGNYYSLRATNTISPYVANSSWVQLTVEPLAVVVQLIATNYDPVAGVWADSSGNGNNASYEGASAPTLVSVVTPNGGSAVDIAAGGGSFLLSSSLDPSSGYTVFAYIMPSVVSDGNRHALTGGSSPGALEYDFYAGHQDYLQEYQADLGHGTATIPTTSFSLVDLAVNSSGAIFRLDGAPDATVAGAAFGSPLTRIGNNEGGGDGFVGQIAEIDIYSGALSSIQISNIEAQLTANYGAINTVATNRIDITAEVSGNQLYLSWPVSHTGWRLELQRNNLSQGVSVNPNDWMTVAGSTATNQATITIESAQPAEFYRLVYP
jgi:hypothetical protein